MSKLSEMFMDDARRNRMVPFISVILGFLVGAIIILLSGANPIEAYGALIQGAFGSLKKIGDTLLYSTTLILTGLAVAFAFKTGLFNIGASGQMLMGGFIAVLLGITLDLPRIILLPICITSSIVAGAVWAFIPGVLKAKYRVHEVVTTIMMNWISVWTVYYFVPELIRGPFDTESANVPANALLRTEWMTKLFDGSYVNLGLFLALITALIIWWVLDRTTFGYELKAVGFNPDAAQYSGMKVNRNIIYSMMISGALAGLAGATFYIGYASNIKIGVSPTQGFDGIAVALLGLNHPLGVVLAALLFGFMNAGKLSMQIATGVPNELVPIIIATIIFFAATNEMIKGWLKRIGNKKSDKERGAK
ncbi:ABC transporter permease [Vallitalea okinawensis]|uniref:ABC transporter permease n=1 Tax=Vallitalea okinawensis TaxID=2078660 RepID=UPI000CFA967A|nr:ABC transporter permease [Vallitalea okinawensis]